MAVGRARLGGTRSGRVVMAGLAIAACASLPAACDSGNGSSTTDTIPSVTPSTAPFTYQNMRVDLRITGSHNLAIAGVVGQCRFAAAGLPPAYIVKDPQLGPTGQLIVYGTTSVPGRGIVPPNVKALINGTGLVSQNTGKGVAVRPDLQSVALNTSMAGPAVGSNGAVTGWATDQLTGTLQCV